MLYRTVKLSDRTPLDLARLSGEEVNFLQGPAGEWFVSSATIGGASASGSRLRTGVYAPFVLDCGLAHCHSLADIPSDSKLAVKDSGLQWRRMLQYRCEEAAWPPVGWAVRAAPTVLDPSGLLIAPMNALECSPELAVDGDAVVLNDVGDAVLSGVSSVHAAQLAAGVWQFDGVVLQAMKACDLVDQFRGRRDKGNRVSLELEGVALALRFVADSWDAEASITAENIAGLISTLDLTTHETMLNCLKGVEGSQWYLDQILKCLDKTQHNPACDSDTLTACSAARVFLNPPPGAV